jgi:hypothetical protein
MLGGRWFVSVHHCASELTSLCAKFYVLSWVPLRFICSGPKPQNLTAFGDRVFKEVIKLKNETVGMGLCPIWLMSCRKKFGHLQIPQRYTRSEKRP